QYRHEPLLGDKVVVWTFLENELYERYSMDILKMSLDQQTKKYWSQSDQKSHFSQQSGGQSDNRLPPGEDILAVAMLEIIGTSVCDLPQLGDTIGMEAEIFGETLEHPPEGIVMSMTKDADLVDFPVFTIEDIGPEPPYFSGALGKSGIITCGNPTTDQPDPKKGSEATTPATAPASGGAGQSAAQS
ncbi:MAG: hypothetical protein GY737_30860, partial [Desulfobacteraceae bacterium]|nr:hypothetical protein [Desulfobacteraceae bacterium]